MLSDLGIGWSLSIADVFGRAVSRAILTQPCGCSGQPRMKLPQQRDKTRREEHTLFDPVTPIHRRPNANLMFCSRNR